MVQTTKLMLVFFTTHPVEIVTGLLGNVDWAEGRKEIQPPRTVAFWTSPSVRRQVSRGGGRMSGHRKGERPRGRDSQVEKCVNQQAASGVSVSSGTLRPASDDRVTSLVRGMTSQWPGR